MPLDNENDDREEEAIAPMWVRLHRRIPFIYDSYQYTTQVTAMCATILGIYCLYREIYSDDEYKFEEYEDDEEDMSRLTGRLRLFTGAYGFISLLNMLMCIIDLQSADNYFMEAELIHMLRLCKLKSCLYYIIVCCIALDIVNPFILLKCIVLSGFVW